MPNVIRKRQKKEGPERCKLEVEKRIEEGLEEESGELEAESSNINNEDTLESGQTNV